VHQEAPRRSRRCRKRQAVTRSWGAKHHGSYWQRNAGAVAAAAGARREQKTAGAVAPAVVARRKQRITGADAAAVVGRHDEAEDAPED